MDKPSLGASALVGAFLILFGSTALDGIDCPGSGF